MSAHLIKVMLTILVALLLKLVPATEEHAPVHGGGHEFVPAEINHNTIVQLFDFELYRKRFHKTYSGALELMARAKCFMGRALRVVVAAVQYSRGERTHFLSINDFSDSLMEELDRMHNTALDQVDQSSRIFTAEMPSSDHGDHHDHGEVHDQGPMNDANEARADGSELGQLEQETSSSSFQSPFRKIPLDKLINTGQDVHLPAKTVLKILIGLESGQDLINNESPKHHNGDLVDQQVPLELVTMKRKRREQDVNGKRPEDGSLARGANLTRSRSSMMENIDFFLDGFREKYRTIKRLVAPVASRLTGPLPDEVFVDLRDTNCFFLPRRQFYCGSCYAFAAVTLMEYLYCRQTNQLVAFSEQYIVDCGTQYYNQSIFGCTGAFNSAVAAYIQNFGLELRTLYPYRARLDQCPYEQNYDLYQTGAIRMDLRRVWKVPIERFVDVLRMSPIILSINHPRDFLEYGGGVHLGECNTAQPNYHAMLVVGHGRQDGEEYWLLRNSYSVGWGEGGHYKMSKRTSCIYKNIGYIYGSSDAVKLDPVIKLNHRYDELIIQEDYVRKL